MLLQLALDIKVENFTSFNNYFITVKNQQLISHLKEIIQDTKSDQYLFFSGKKASGKTHLLCAICDYAEKHNKKAFYLSLKDVINCTSEIANSIFENIDIFSVVCIDDLDVISGNVLWQELLFDLYNQCLDKNIKLIVSSSKLIEDMDISLADLKSRLLYGVRYHVYELDDDQKIDALKLHAKNRAMDLSNEVASYIIKRCSRNMNSLYKILDALDKASWQKQRKLTVPFIKSVLKF